MFPSGFDESNGFLGKPSDMNDEQCESLSIWRGQATVAPGPPLPTVISCWKLTKEELEEVNRTGRVWLFVVGHTMPPVLLSGHKPMLPQPAGTD